MDELCQRIQQALRQYAAPAMGLDGSEMTVVAMEQGIASVRFAGACASCPASLSPIIMGLEAELRRHVPEVEMIEAVL